jgi:hypothetical protein
MSTRTLLNRCGLISLVLGFPFVVLHLLANPDDAAISPLQHAAAATANFFGPWGGALVRIVDFPNAGWQTFHLGWAIALTLIGGGMLACSPWMRNRVQQYGFLAGWTVFVAVWFVVGFTQIASGLL